MARIKDKVPPQEAAPVMTETATASAPFAEGMVNIRSVSGGVMIDPYTLIRFDSEPQRVVVTNWVQCQIEAGKLAVVGD